MTAAEILALADPEILEIGKKLRIGYKLKGTIRYAGTRDLSVHGESVAEHVYALMYLAQYFLPFEDPDHKLKRERVYEMIVFHDFGEILNGDIPYHMKTEADEKREVADARHVFASLPQPFGVQSERLWEEFELQNTPESRFAHALDKAEPVFELFDPVTEKTLHRTHFTYQMHVGKKIPATEGFPVIRKFVDVLSADMQKRGVFWEG